MALRGKLCLKYRPKASANYSSFFTSSNRARTNPWRPAWTTTRRMSETPSKSRIVNSTQTRSAHKEETLFTPNRYALMSENAALSSYLLDATDLSDLPYLVKQATPERPSQSRRLFLQQDVQFACLRRWGSKSKLLAERNKLAAAPTVTSQVYSQREEGQASSGAHPKELSPPLLQRIRAAVKNTKGLKAVASAALGNSVIMVVKMVGFACTGAGSLLAEAVHSLADVVNQLLLIIGIYQSSRSPDLQHPYGYGSERYVWSLISGVGIFFIGCGYTIWHGLHSLMHPEPLVSPGIAFAVLGISFIVEGASLAVAVKEVAAEARQMQMSLLQYVKSGSDPMAVAVLLEDSVGILGVGVASACVGLSMYTGSMVWDSVGSIAIGCMLGAVAVFLIQKNRLVLVGQSIPEDRLARTIDRLLQDEVVVSVHDVKGVLVGDNEGRFKAEINFNAEALFRRMATADEEFLNALNAASRSTSSVASEHADVAGAGHLAAPSWHALALLSTKLRAQRDNTISSDSCATSAGSITDRIVEAKEQEEAREVLLGYSASLVTALGIERDRLEAIVREELPEVKYVNLEVL